MELILDFGNTLKKVAVFDKEKMVELLHFKKFELEDLILLIEKYPLINSAIISSVIDYSSEINNYCEENLFFIALDDHTPIPVINNYKTPKTLGKDRIAAVVAANAKFPEKNILVIDAGSCITYDIINASGEYLGGSISPGVTLRFKSLNNFTDKLPLIEKSEIDYLTGTTTEQSILSGVLNGICFEIDGIINEYSAIYDNLTIILSGGDYNYFDKRLKNNIFALPNIVLEGLNIILGFNDNR